MRVAIVYRPNSEYEREIFSWLRDLRMRTGKVLEEINPDTREGAAFAATYDLVEYPTIIALDPEGKVQNLWRGTPLPLIDEVGYYVQ